MGFSSERPWDTSHPHTSLVSMALRLIDNPNISSIRAIICWLTFIILFGQPDARFQFLYFKKEITNCKFCSVFDYLLGLIISFHQSCLNVLIPTHILISG